MISAKKKSEELKKPNLPPLPGKEKKMPELPKKLPELPEELKKKPEPKPEEKPAPMPAPAMGSAVGPMFVSMNKYHELKTNVAYLKQSSAHMRSIIEALKQNRAAGGELLRQSMEQLQFIEGKIEEVKGVVKPQ